MAAVVQIPQLTWLDRWRTVPAYGRKLGEVMAAAESYGDTLAEEVAVGTGRSPQRGRALISLGHGLGWGGLALSLLGFATIDRPDLEQLLFGPFGLGLLMQIPSGALVRAGRRELRPVDPELAAYDRRRPVLLLRGFRDAADTNGAVRDMTPALTAYGPLLDAATIKPAFGETDVDAEVERGMDQAVLVVLAPHAVDGASAELEAIARRGNAHKLLMLLPALRDTEARRNRWQQLRAALAVIPGFATLPDAPPAGLIGLHLSSSGEPVLLTASASPHPRDYERAVAAAIYGMKCHGKW